MTLGAQQNQVVALVLRRSLIVVAIGLVLGLGGAVAGTWYVAGLLFGLAPQDRSTFAYVAVAFALVSMTASYLPARRATRLDPLVALRCE